MQAGRCCRRCSNWFPADYWSDAPKRALCAYCYAVGHLSPIDSCYSMWRRGGPEQHEREPRARFEARKLVPLPRPTGPGEGAARISRA